MKNKKKLCIIGSGHMSATLGGLEYQIGLLIESLKKQEGVDIYFVTHNVADDYEPKGYFLKIIKIDKKLFRYGTFFGLKETYQILKIVKPDIVYQRGSSAVIFAGAFYSMRYGCKLIWHVSSDNNLIQKKNKIKIHQINKFVENLFFKYGIKKAHKIIAQTNYQASLVSRYNQTAEIKVVRNFHPVDERKKCGQKKDQIVWVGNIKILKQPELFIELVKKISFIKKNVQFIMIGSPTLYPLNYQKRLEGKIKKIPNLKYIGKQPLTVVNDYIRESKLLVNTSKWEGFPNTYIQAWVRETPVITLNCDPDNVIKNFGLGLHSKNFEKLVADTLRLLNDDQLRISMGKKAKKYALKFHTLKNLNEMVEIVLN
jgi:glycosyltransferase involved in cell wall biosynthesis